MSHINTQLYFNTLLHLLTQHERTQPLLEILPTAKLSDSEKELISKSAKIVLGKSPKGNQNVLWSIFDGLGKEENENDLKVNGTQHVPQRVMGLGKEDAFPNKANQDKKEWLEGFKNDVKKLNLNDNPTLTQVETLLFVLQKWTAQLPSNQAVNIPFYEFLKLTAAAVLCLESADNQQDKSFLMIGGGVSGIQGYLYDIVSKNASKNLKGRSFYIQMLADAVLYKILNELGLCQANIVYSSGGGFYLLAPNNTKTQNAFKVVKNTIAQELFSTHRIALYMELQYEECSANDLQDNFGKVCKQLANKIGNEKKHKFDIQLISNFEELFEPSEVGGETFCDAISGEELLDGEKIYELEDAFPQIFTETATEDHILVNEKTALQIKLGMGLRNVNSYSIDLQQITNKNDIEFPVKIGVIPNFKDDNKASTHDYLFDINNLDFLKDYVQNQKVKGFQFYGGNNYPKIHEIHGKGIIFRPKTFSELGGSKEDLNKFYSKKKTIEKTQIEYLEAFQEPSFKRLGVLRMDVDGLGTIFREGLPSLAAYGTLSRNLDWFFKGYLNTIWEQHYEGENGLTQIIYSGGDDLFIVGRWNKIIDFAESIQQEFKEYVLNEKLTISGGIAIVTPKFPIIKAANDYAAKAEKASKNYNGKNAITIFGETFSWKGEFEKVKELKIQFVKFCDANILPKTFLYKLDGFYYMAFPPQSEERKVSEDISWHWQMAYDIARLEERTFKNNNIEAKAFLRALKQWAIMGKSNLTEQEKYGGKSFFRYLRTAVIWASYELRNK